MVQPLLMILPAVVRSSILILIPVAIMYRRPTYTYTVTPPTFTLPAAGSSTVACAALAVIPTVPVVYDSFGS